MAIEQLEYCTAETNIIASLADKPNAQSGMTAAQLKAKFDAADAAIKEYINKTLVPYVNETLGTMDTRLGEHDAAFEADDDKIVALKADSHTHENKELLDSYAQTEADLADAVTKKHEHTNKTALDTYNKTQTELLRLGCNPNLLDNWCFLPCCIVNQRGASSYAKPDANNNSSKFGYDRWHLRNVTATAQTNGLELRKNGGTPYLMQTVENANALKGKTVTASFLLDGITGTSTDFYAAVSNGTFSIAVGTEFGHSISCQNGLITVTCDIPADATINYFNVSIRILDGKDATACTLVAAKLELGTQQTLAHKDASGNWVLNEVPNYGTELIKCLRYYRRSWTGEISKFGAVGLPSIGVTYQRPCVHWEVPMRALPVVTIYDATGTLGYVTRWGDDVPVQITGASYISANGFAIHGGGNLERDMQYAFHYEASSEL